MVFLFLAAGIAAIFRPRSSITRCLASASGACSLLAGFGMAAAAARSWMHMVLFAGTLTVALYIVTDMDTRALASFGSRASVIF
jgi:hypothetical protein